MAVARIWLDVASCHDAITLVKIASGILRTQAVRSTSVNLSHLRMPKNNLWFMYQLMSPGISLYWQAQRQLPLGAGRVALVWALH